MLLKKPAFTLIAVITLSLGIGVNTALFAGFNLLLRPSPIKDPDTIVKIERQSENSSRNFSYSDYVYYRDHAQTLSDFLPTIEEKFLLREHTSVVEPDEIKGIFTSDNFLSALGGNMRLGRFFTQEENRVARTAEILVLSGDIHKLLLHVDVNTSSIAVGLRRLPLLHLWSVQVALLRKPPGH
jgi:putative ABC transport system permease protein